jgi:hypothetical protein
MRLTNFSTSLDFSLSELLKKNKNKKTPNAATAQNAGNQEIQETNRMPGSNLPGQQNIPVGTVDPFGYMVFDIPWSLNMSYNFSYFKSGLTSTITQGLTFSGNLSITKKMSATFTSGYDFTGKKITMTNIAIHRDLHCWEMALNWIPNGTMKGWNFTIKVKASVLGDLKYDRKKDYHDSY